MNKIWLILIGIGAYQWYITIGPGSRLHEVDTSSIYGHWATTDESTWFEFNQNGVATGVYEGVEFVGSFRNMGDGSYHVLKTRNGEQQVVFLRGKHLVCITRYVTYELRKKKDFYPGNL